MSAHPISLQGGFALRFERGSRHDQRLTGHFLAWQGGYFIPCNSIDQAKAFTAPNIAREVAFRAEHAYPGARFTVVPVTH